MDTSLSQGCFSFVEFILDCVEGYCSQILCIAPSRVRCREEGLGSTVQVQALKFNPKRVQTSEVRKRSMRTDLGNFIRLSYSYRNNLMTWMC